VIIDEHFRFSFSRIFCGIASAIRLKRKKLFPYSQDWLRYRQMLRWLGNNTFAPFCGSEFLQLLPAGLELLMRRCTISQIKIDQTLIWNAFRLGHILEVVDCLFVYADSYLPFQLVGIWIFDRF
jgi:hypothetical protein